MKRPAVTSLLGPAYWPTWLGYSLMWLITRLPHRWQIRSGAFLGSIGFIFARRRRHIVDVNLRLCFPLLDETARDKLVARVFRSTGISLIETAIGWLGDPHDFDSMVTINGLEHLDDALKKGHGAIMLGMHFSTLDFIGAVLSLHLDFDVMYRPNKNKLLEAIMTRGRNRLYGHVFHRDDMRGVLRSLKKNRIVWYAPDQDYGRRHSVFAPFFGVPAATITATARIARISGAPVIVFTHYRGADDRHYEINFTPLPDFPTGDDVEDATVVNHLVEEAILKCPEQYWWLHRRFKTRPAGEARPY